MDQKASAKVLVLDFGAQYGQLIARRVRDLNVYSEIVPCDISADEIREMNAEELNQKLASLKEELFNLRFQLATGQLENPMRISAVKKDIARVKTVIRANELSKENA